MRRITRWELKADGREFNIVVQGYELRTQLMHHDGVEVFKEGSIFYVLAMSYRPAFVGVEEYASLSKFQENDPTRTASLRGLREIENIFGPDGIDTTPDVIVDVLLGEAA